LQFAIDVFGEHFLSECLTPTINKAVRGFSFKVIHPCFVQVSDTALENDIIIIWKDVRGARHVSDREQDSWLLPTKSIELIPRGHSGIWRFDELSTLDIFEIDNSKKIEIAKTFGLNNNCLLNHIFTFLIKVLKAINKIANELIELGVERTAAVKAAKKCACAH
jgi:hypothetical protein